MNRFRYDLTILLEINLPFGCADIASPFWELFDFFGAEVV